MGLDSTRSDASRQRAVRRRVAAALTCIALLTVGTVEAATAGGAPKLPKGPKIDRTKPCTLLSGRQVAKVFGASVTVDPTNAESPLAIDCAWIVGDPGAPEGRLEGLVLYPAFGGAAQLDAVEIVESDRVNAQVSGPGVVDLPIGKGGFIQTTQSLFEVAPTKRFAFSLRWLPTGAPFEGSTLTDDVRARLTRLATDVAKRGKTAHKA